MASTFLCCDSRAKDAECTGLGSLCGFAAEPSKAFAIVPGPFSGDAHRSCSLLGHILVEFLGSAEGLLLCFHNGFQDFRNSIKGTPTAQKLKVRKTGSQT